MGVPQGQQSASAIITATVPPALLAVADGGTLAATLAASATDPANYSSRKGSIATVTAEWSLDGGAWITTGATTVRTGQTIAARVTVTDNKGNRQEFAAGPVTVLPRVPQAVGSLSDSLVELGVAILAIETARAFSGEGLAYALAPSSAALVDLGLALDPVSGRITGTPKLLAAARKIVVRASNAAGHAEAGFGLTVGDQPAAMAAPTVSASGEGLLVVRAAPPAENHSAILRHDLRHSPDQATWTERIDIREQTQLSGLAAGTKYHVQTRAVNALGAGPWSPSGQAITASVTVTVSARVAPAMAPLYEGQAVRDVPGYATMVGAENFTVQGSSLAGVAVSFLGDAAAAGTALLEGQRAGFRVTVTTAAGTVSTFETGLVTVAHAVRVESSGDNLLSIEINDLVPAAQTLPVTVTEEPWASRGSWPVLISRDLLAAGPVNLVRPLVRGEVSEGSLLTLSTGLWLYDGTGVEPVLSWQWKRDGAAIAGATGTTHVIAAADAGHTVAVTETASSGTQSRSATSAGVAVAGPSTSLSGTVSGDTITMTSFDDVPALAALASGDTITVTSWG